MATKKTCLILLSLASVALAAGRTPAKVRVLEERAKSDVLRVEIVTPDKVHSYSLQKTLVRTPVISTLHVTPDGNITVEEVTIDRLLRLYEDEESGTRLYKNSKEALEGMLSHKLALKHEDDGHFVVDINEANSDNQGTKYASGDLQLQASDKDERKPLKRPSDMRKIAKNRQSDDLKYTVELAVLVDSAMYSKFGSWWDLVTYLTVFWKVVDRRFDSIEYGIDINVALTSIYASPSVEIDNHFIEFIDPEHADLEGTLNKLGHVVYSASWCRPPFDVMQLQTGLTLATVNPVTFGLETDYTGAAFLGSACYMSCLFAYNIGIALDDASYSHIRTSTRQLARNLGAPYDGEGYGYYCDCDWNYIMGCSFSYYELSFSIPTFSHCSIDCMIDYYLYDYSASCLKNISNYDYYRYPDDYPGKYKSLNEQCRERSGYDSAVFDEALKDFGVECLALSCIIDDDFDIYRFTDYAPPLEGTPCGTGGMCLDGFCQFEHDSEIYGIFGEDESEEEEEEGGEVEGSGSGVF